MKRKKGEVFYKDKNSGFGIGMANHIAGTVYSGYPIFLSIIIVGIIARFFNHSLDPKICTVFSIGVMALCYIPAYKAVFSHDRYLEYYKVFEKKDAAWHRKWKRITLMLVLGLIPFFIICIILMFEILGMPVLQMIYHAIIK